MPETTPSAGATPVAAGATPAQTPAQPAAGNPAPTTPATGDDTDGLGDAGTRALRAEREARAAASRERDDFKRQLEELQNATRSDSEKALAQAKKDGVTEAVAKLHPVIRRSAVRAALSSAGVASEMLDLAVRADQFASLKVSDDGDVEGLDGAVADFKKAMPALFKPGAPTNGAAPDFGGGPRGTPAGAGADMNSLIRRAAGRSA
jgi:hypothetical protein